MTVELTKNEAMWIIDRAAKECVKGQAAIDALSDETDDEIKSHVDTARNIVKALAELGLKIADAFSKELDKEELVKE